MLVLRECVAAGVKRAQHEPAQTCDVDELFAVATDQPHLDGAIQRGGQDWLLDGAVQRGLAVQDQTKLVAGGVGEG